MNRFLRVIIVGIISILIYYIIFWNTPLYRLLNDIFHSELLGTWITIIVIVLVIKLMIKKIYFVPNKIKTFIIEVIFLSIVAIIGFEGILLLISMIRLMNFE